jgi:hypothetical protein
MIFIKPHHRFLNRRFLDGITEVKKRCADRDGYLSKEPINMSNVPFPIPFAQLFPVWKQRTAF